MGAGLVSLSKNEERKRRKRKAVRQNEKWKEKDRLPRFVLCWRSGAMAGFVVNEWLWRREAKGTVASWLFQA